jgi:hypothetical protein
MGVYMCVRVRWGRREGEGVPKERGCVSILTPCNLQDDESGQMRVW